MENKSAMKTPQDIINEAAKHHEFRSKIQTFDAGATFALSTPELWREGLDKLLDWMEDMRFGYISDDWKTTSGDYTRKMVIDSFLEHLKTQQPVHQLVCRLDEQQCQQECEHKNNRANCPFISTVK